jgi:hypothetical protein
LAHKQYFAAEQTGKSGRNAEQQITALSEQVGQAYVKDDISLWEKYLADDYRQLVLTARCTLRFRKSRISNPVLSSS